MIVLVSFGAVLLLPVGLAVVGVAVTKLFEWMERP